jgi:hypothetical protein
MKKLLTILLVLLLVSLFWATTAFASPGDPLGAARRISIHPFMDHSGDPMHQHIGVTQDLNGDGYICMKMLTNDLHLHVDNFLPLP